MSNYLKYSKLAEPRLSFEKRNFLEIAKNVKNSWNQFTVSYLISWKFLSKTFKIFILNSAKKLKKYFVKLLCSTKICWFHGIFAEYSQTSFSMLSFLFGFDLPIIRLQRKCYLFCLNKDIWIDSLVSKFKCAVYTTFLASKYASIFSGAT